MADVILAPDHKGMKIDYRGALKEARRVLRRDFGAISAHMLEELEKHLTEMGERFYAGDTAAVDEFLQLYCIARDKRPPGVGGKTK